MSASATAELERMLTTVSNDFNTPQIVIDPVRTIAGGRIGLDPCSNPYSIVGARTEWSTENGDDGLANDWRGHGLVYFNPPYSLGQQAKWVTKAEYEADRGVEIIGLTQSRTDTRWFNRIFSSAQAVCFWHGRLGFLGGTQTPTFASAVSYWGEFPHLFAHVFGEHGKVVIL